MGLPVKHRKKYVSHKKRWDKATIEEESFLVKDYALKNKREVRKVELQISKYKKIAKELNKNTETKESAQAKAFIQRLKGLGFLKPEATLIDEVLDITLRDVLERRISNIIYKNKLARTPKQARQFIVHGHVKVGDKVITSPSHLVSLDDEAKIEFVGRSSLADENHPERNLEAQAEGLKEKMKEMEETPLVTEHEGDSDAKEEALDNEEQDEVQND